MVQVRPMRGKILLFLLILFGFTIEMSLATSVRWRVRTGQSVTIEAADRENLDRFREVLTQQGMADARQIAASLLGDIPQQLETAGPSFRIMLSIGAGLSAQAFVTVDVQFDSGNEAIIARNIQTVLSNTRFEIDPFDLCFNIYGLIESSGERLAVELLRPLAQRDTHLAYVKHLALLFYRSQAQPLTLPVTSTQIERAFGRWLLHDGRIEADASNLARVKVWTPKKSEWWSDFKNPSVHEMVSRTVGLYSGTLEYFLISACGLRLWRNRQSTQWN